MAGKTIPLRLVSRWMLRTLLAWLCLAVVFEARLLADSPRAPASKISPIILAHQREKADTARWPRAERRARLRALGIGADDPTAEQCALYVSAKLNARERAELATNNIKVDPDRWVPPVAGRHANGFYSVTVPYAALLVIRNHPRIVYAESLESVSHPLNANARYLIKAEDVLNGTGVVARDGTGINIAVADTGIDLAHADFPVPVETYDMTTGASTADWSTTVANTVMDHGTHVTGSALGRGALSPNNFRRGAAPGAALYFYKIGDNTTAAASDADMIEAINRALAVGCDIFSLSYGGVSPFMDGSSPVCQAIDNASAAGMACIVAAGNDGDTNRHASVSVAPATTSATFGFSVSNVGGGATYVGPEDLRVLWQDGNALDNNLTLSCTNLGGGESLTAPWSSSSARGTEARQYFLTVNLAPGASKTYNLRLQNTAASGATPLVHTWRAGGRGTFTSPDSNYTINHPGVADTAVTIGALVQSNEWRDWQNTLWQFQTWAYGVVAPFSSRGPRLDGWLKPNVLAPGAVTASCRDGGSFAGYPLNQYIIDNDGNNNGQGPADYYIHWGTSMACPMAAGAAALLLEAAPGLTPAQLLAVLESTASNAANPDNVVGAGLIDMVAAIQMVDCDNNGVYDPVDVANQDCNGSGLPDACDTYTNPFSFTASSAFIGNPGYAYDMALADLNGDAYPDLVVGDGSNFRVDLLTANGDGTFSAPSYYFIQELARSIAAGDIDGDGDDDLVAGLLSNPRSLRVYLGDGAGGFTPGSSYTLPGNANPYVVHLSDLDRDNLLDVICINQVNVAVFMNTGGGVLGTPVTYAASGFNARGIVTDIDGDGYPDLAVATGASAVNVLMNDRTGSFGSPVTYLAEWNPIAITDVAAADLDADGLVDLAVTLPDAGMLIVLWNDGTGGFGSNLQIQQNVGSSPGLITAPDVDGDGVPDLVAVLTQFPEVSIQHNNGDRTFTGSNAGHLNLFQPAPVTDLIATDLDLDGRMDLLVTTPSSASDINVVMNGTTPPTGMDCNVNLVPDDCEIASGAAQDCQSDGIPDVCQLAANDCNGNGVPDDCDIGGGGSFDANANSVPDECELLVCATCRGDLDGDNDVDGADLQAFSACALAVSAAASGCACADMDANATVDSTDVAALVNKLLSDPNPACP